MRASRVNAAESATVLAYDGSDGAKQAIRSCPPVLASRRAVLVHVWQSPARLLLHTDIRSLTGPMKEAAEELDASDRHDAGRLVEEGVELARTAGFEATATLVEGKAKAWPSLLEFADEQQAAAVVVGTRGLAGAKSMLLGSVSAGVLNHSRRPVVVVPPGSREHDGPLVLGFDGSEQARLAVEVAGRLLSPREVVVVTAWTSCLEVASGAVLATPGGVSRAGAERLDAEIEAGAEQTAEEGAELARAAGLGATARAEPARGSASATVVQVAEECDARAVVVGSHGRGAIVSALIGSVSRGVVHHARVPVLVVPPPS